MRQLLLLAAVTATLGAFAKGALSDSADFWTRKSKSESRAVSVLEKGYVDPKAASRKTAGTEDADLLLGLLVAEVEAAPTRTNAVKKTVAKPVAAQSKKKPTIAKPVESVAKVEPPVVIERTNVVEKVVEKPVEVEKIVTVEKQVTNTVEVVKVEKVEVEVEKPVTNFVEKIVEKPVDRIVEKIVEVEKPVEVEKIVTVEKPVEKIVERTNVVEKIVKVDRPVVVEKSVTNVVEKIVEKPVDRVVEKVVEKPVEVEKIVTVEKQVTNTVEVVKVEKVEVEVEKPVTNFVEKIVEKPVDRIVERIVEVEKPVEVEKIVTVEKPVTNIVEKIVEVEKKVVVEKPVQVIVERTNVVEKVVYDRSMELRLAQDKTELERRGGMLEARNAGLEKRNDELKRELEEERRRRERLERTLPGAGKPRSAKTGRPARITSKETYYDRKRGIALFDGNVYVDDDEYQLHADKAYVFTDGGSNDVRRIVAVGHVAMTNDLKRAYGGKVSYYRQDGMVVLYAGDGIAAEVRDESKAEDQTVRGSRIKFWIGNDQVEVLDATISAPTEGAGMGGSMFGK